jgi:hypothetical protein
MLIASIVKSMRQIPKTCCDFQIANCVPRLIWVIALILPAAFWQAGGSHQTTGDEFERPVYVPLDRSEEDWSILNDPELRKDPWDPLKYIVLLNAPGWYLTLAGEERSFDELYRNYHWGAGPQDGNGSRVNETIHWT